MYKEFYKSNKDKLDLFLKFYLQKEKINMVWVLNKKGFGRQI